MTTTAYLAAPGFEKELEQELSSQRLINRFDRLFHVEGPVDEKIAWAQDVWPAPELITISSIADGAKKLRKLNLRWVPVPFQLHRRTTLIQAQLPKVVSPQSRFLEPKRESKLGSWTLVSPEQILACTRSQSAYPRGEISFLEDKTAPSRAYLKLWELFTVHGIRPKPGSHCLDLGASPGGWSWVLANQLKCRVTAVDRSELHRKVMELKNFEFIKRNAFTLRPSEIGPIDWLFSDVICYPAQLFELVEVWLASGFCKNFVCTLKFKGPTDHATAGRFQSVKGSHLRHLSVNKHELTWWLTTKA